MEWLIVWGVAALAACLLVRGASEEKREQEWIDAAMRNVKWPASSK